MQVLNSKVNDVIVDIFIMQALQIYLSAFLLVTSICPLWLLTIAR